MKRLASPSESKAMTSDTSAKKQRGVNDQYEVEVLGEPSNQRQGTFIVTNSEHSTRVDSP